MPTSNGVAESTDDSDQRPDRWHERDEKRHLARAVIRELHDRERYKLARWARELHHDPGGIGPVGQAIQEYRDEQGYRRRSIKQLADDFVEASEMPENCGAWEHFEDAPMPELRDPDAVDLWNEADKRYRYGSTGSDRQKVRAVCLRLWDLGLGPLAAATALHHSEGGPSVGEEVRTHDTLDEAVRHVADLWLRNPDDYGVTGYAGKDRVESRDVLEDY